MRLLKLAIYSLLGFVIYEFVQGVRAEGGRRSGEDRGPNLTGPGEGIDVEVADSDGGGRRQTVGRGVVH